MIEQTLIFGPEQHLVGTVTLPDPALPRPPGLMALLTNAGVIPRIGPHRLNVALARRFAQLGIPTLRFDMSGLGDSRRSSSRRTTSEQAVADTRAAMDAAQQFGGKQFFMVGFCSGGDVAHIAALADPRLRAIVMWDSYVYPTRKAKLRGFFHRLRRLSLTSAARKVTQRLIARRRKPEASADGQPPEGPPIFGRTRMPARDDFGQRIRTLVDRGVDFLFLYSGGEPEWYNYHGQFRDMFSAYGFVDRVVYEYIVRNDHTFIQPHARAALMESVERWLHQRVLPNLAQGRSEPTEAAASVPVLTAA